MPKEAGNLVLLMGAGDRYKARRKIAEVLGDERWHDAVTLNLEELQPHAVRKSIQANWDLRLLVLSLRPDVASCFNGHPERVFFSGEDGFYSFLDRYGEDARVFDLGSLWAQDSEKLSEWSGWRG